MAESEMKRREMLSVERMAVMFVRRRPTRGEGCQVPPLVTVPPSRTLTRPRRLLTTTLTRIVEFPVENMRTCQSPAAKHMGGVVTVAPAGMYSEYWSVLAWT